jgi:hypothetical protein
MCTRRNQAYITQPYDESPLTVFLSLGILLTINSELLADIYWVKAMTFPLNVHIPHHLNHHQLNNYTYT